MKPNIEKISNLEKRLLIGNRSRRPLVVRTVFYSLYFVGILLGRLFESMIALIVLILITIPVLLFLICRKILLRKNIFKSEKVYGYKGKAVVLRYFEFKSYLLANLSLFYYVLAGSVSLVGVSIKKYDSESRVIGDSYLFNNKPGIFNLYYIRASSKIGHEGKHDIEWEYIFRKSLVGDLTLIFKSIPAFFYFNEQSDFNETVNLFNIDFNNVTMADSIELLSETIENRKKRKVFFVNPDCLNKIFNNNQYCLDLQNGDYVFPDGIGIHLACKILHNPLKENVNGTDMLPFLCQMAVDKKYSIYLLGAKPGVAENMKLNLESKYSGLEICGFHHGYFNHDTESSIIIEKINRCKPDIILVAFGAPFQERWISNNAGSINTHVLMGVGGLMDFYSENIKRAPKWMREIGLEWVYRLIQEPGRMWRRYIIGNPLFIFRVLKWKFSKLTDQGL